jgi:hypothetical protein
MQQLINQFGGPGDRSVLPDLAVKGLILRGGVRVAEAARNLIVCLVAGLAAVLYFHLPGTAVAVFFGVLALNTMVEGVVTVLRLRAVANLETAADGNVLRSTFLLNEKYHVAAATFNAGISALAFLGVALLGKQLVLTLSLQSVNAEIPDISIPFLSLMILPVLYVLGKLALHAVYLITAGQIGRDLEVGKVYQQILVIRKSVQSLEFLPVAVALACALWFLGLPGWIVAIFGGVPLLLFVVSAIEVYRIQQIQMTPSVAASPASAEKEFQPGELVEGASFGLMNLRQTGNAVMGVGKASDAENALVLTNRRMVFIQVPLPGGNNIIGAASFNYMNVMLNRPQLITEGKKLLASGDPQKIVQYIEKTFSYEDLESVSVKNKKLEFRTRGGKKYQYMCWEEEGTIVEILRKYAGDKVKL